MSSGSPQPKDGMKISRAQSKVVMVVLLAGLLPWLVSLAANYQFGTIRHFQEPVHECLELVGACLAFAVAMLLLLRAGHEKTPPHMLWVMAALVAMGLVDGVHAVLPFGFAWSWLRHGATLIGGLLFGLVWLRLPEAVVRRKPLFIATVAALTIAGTLVVVWRPDLLPAPWDASSYTFAAKITNMVGGLGFVAAAMFFLRRYARDPQAEHLVFGSQTVLFGTASLLFGYSHLWAADWWAWHGFRLAAYAIVLVFAYSVSTHDIAERRRAEAAVRRGEERYRSLVVATSQIVWTTNAQGEVAGDMPMWRDFTGQSLTEIQGWGWIDYVHPDDRERTAAAWRTAVQNRTLYELEYRLRRKDGEYRVVSVRGVPVLESDGSIREWVGTCTDITDSKQAEEQLRKASLYARSLLEASLDPLVTIRRDGRIADANQAAELVTGVSRQQLIGSDFSDYFTQPEKAQQGYEEVFAKGSVHDYPLAIRHTSGRITEVLYNASIFANEAGAVEGVFAAARDITARKHAEEELRKTSLYARSLLEASLDPLVTIRKDGKITDVNHATELATGISRQKLVGRKVL